LPVRPRFIFAQQSETIINSPEPSETEFTSAQRVSSLRSKVKQLSTALSQGRIWHCQSDRVSSLRRKVKQNIE